MLKEPAVDVAGDSYIGHSGLAGEDIDPVLAHDRRLRRNALSLAILLVQTESEKQTPHFARGELRAT
jgi:hypothetical protein